MYTYIYIHISLSVYIYIYMNTCVHIYIYIHTYTDLFTNKDGSGWPRSAGTCSASTRRASTARPSRSASCSWSSECNILYIAAAPDPPTNVVDFKGFDSSILLI